MRLEGRNGVELFADVTEALKRLTVSPDVNDFAHAAEELFQREEPGERWIPREEAQRRCAIYGAALGDALAMASLCGFLAKDLRSVRSHQHETYYRLIALLGCTSQLNRRTDSFGRDGVQRFLKAGEMVAARLEGLKLISPPQASDRSKDDVDVSPNPHMAKSRFTDRQDKENSQPKYVGKGRIVFRTIGSEKLIQSDGIKELLTPLLGKSLPILNVPDLAPMVTLLRGEFPHASGVIDAMLNDLAGRNEFAMRPVILAGLPGCGKTTFAMRFAALSGLPSLFYPCAGISDAKFLGTARGWSTGGPAMPTSLVMRSEVANPLIILDELDKAGGNSGNGIFSEALLPLLEPRSAAEFFDLFIEANIDLSCLVFIATVNDPARIPSPLRDRCRILQFPSPEPTHLFALVPGLLKGIVTARGLDPRWVSPLTTNELDTLAVTWRGGSLRALQRMIEAVLKARDHGVEYH